MKLQTVEERLTKAKEIFDDFIMKELLSCSHVSECGFSCLFLEFVIWSSLCVIRLLSLLIFPNRISVWTLWSMSKTCFQKGKHQLTFLRYELLMIYDWITLPLNKVIYTVCTNYYCRVVSLAHLSARGRLLKL